MTEPTEEDFYNLLEKLKAKHEDKNGDGSFERSLLKGKLMMEKRDDELTDEERVFLHNDGPIPAHMEGQLD